MAPTPHDIPPTPNEVPCARPATYLAFWPGRDPIPFCNRHALQAAAIAQVLGFRLVVTDPQPDVLCKALTGAWPHEEPR